MKEKENQTPMERVFVPEVIKTPYPFIIIGDVKEVVGKLDRQLLKTLDLELFQQQLVAIQKQYAPEGSTFYYAEQSSLIGKIEDRVQSELNCAVLSKNRVGVINFDKYIFQNSFDPNLFNLNLSRSVGKDLVSRPGSEMKPIEQFQNLINWLKLGQYDQLVLTDDVVAFVTTLPPIIDLIKQELPNVELTVVCGVCSTQGEWMGLEKLTALEVNVKPVILAQASPSVEGGTSGMAIPDSRDSTIFGGKIGWANDGRALSYPYFYPFSEPTSSLMAVKEKWQASQDWMTYNLLLVENIEQQLGRKLAIKDLENNGFGVPYTSIESLEEKISLPSSEMSLSSYLMQWQEILINLVKEEKTNEKL